MEQVQSFASMDCWTFNGASNADICVASTRLVLAWPHAFGS